ncbi:substrate-binding domain-containing protein [Streptomyces massasporeus]|uniref:substrate-binding domain-containing protein n=1 Tax=Streptomyces massasporeus TaxID=67324 RepID=UPI0038228781
MGRPRPAARLARGPRRHRGSRAAAAVTGRLEPGRRYAAGRQLARLADVTAVFVANDDMAIGALHAFADAGRTVPGDVSVVGYDDIPAAAPLFPPLTTVRQNLTALADRAVDTLIALIEGRPAAAGPAGRAVELTVRASTGPAPDRDPAHPRP